MIKAPYNFVPLSNKVFFPDWGKNISIDRPFKDGVSGTISIEYKAVTPVFIGKEQTNNVANNNTETQIENYKSANGSYAIPGSTLRGMIRNVIEIASFGKFCNVSNPPMSLRGFQNQYYKEKFKDVDKNVKAGWLIFDNSKWYLYPVKYYKVDRDTLFNLIVFDGINGVYSGCIMNPRYFMNPNECPKKQEGICNRLYCPSIDLNIRNIDDENRINALIQREDIENEIAAYYDGENYLTITKKRSNLINKIPKKIFPVLTSFSGKDKNREFLFDDKDNSCEKIELSPEILQDFINANMPRKADQKKGIRLGDKWKFYTGKKYPGIPVFYLLGADNKPESFGLSQTYRLAYKKSLHDAIKNTSENHFSEEMDLAECIFGKISRDSNKPENSLRGRVQFEDATTASKPVDKPVKLILSNPKPSYYPTYIKQESNKTDYKTLMDKDVELSGWKRYPVKNTTTSSEIGENNRIVSSFKPLSAGSTFTGKVHFHNLKKEELGALLWAITWGEDKELSHSVGMGKPYGYGQIKAEITKLSYLENIWITDSEEKIDNDYKDCTDDKVSSLITSWIKSFTDEMEKEYKVLMKDEAPTADWENSVQLKELKAMANPKNAERENWNLEYMSTGILEPASKEGEKDKKINEFNDAKIQKLFLNHYSEENQENTLTKNENSPN